MHRLARSWVNLRPLNARFFSRERNHVYDAMRSNRRVWWDHAMAETARTTRPQATLSYDSEGAQRRVMMHRPAEEFMKGENEGLKLGDLRQITKHVRAFGTLENSQMLQLFNEDNEIYCNRLFYDDVIAPPAQKPNLYQMAGIEPMPKARPNRLNIPKSLVIFKELYELCWYSSFHTRPFAPLVHGKLAGPGVALGMHSKYCIASENTQYSVQGPSFGWFADCGQAFFLSRLRMNGLGLYLALTGKEIVGFDLVQTGILSFFMYSSDYEEMGVHARGQYTHDGMMQLFMHYVDTGQVTWGMEDHKVCFHGQLAFIERCFTDKETIEDVYAALEAEPHQKELAAETLALLKSKSPLSMAITVQQLHKAKSMELKEVLQMDYALAANLIKHPQFKKGFDLLHERVKPEDVDWGKAPSEGMVRAAFVAPKGHKEIPFDKMHMNMPDLIHHDSRFTHNAKVASNVDYEGTMLHHPDGLPRDVQRNLYKSGRR